ncbi:hypothetical protein H257_02155 [Aphanomyces astaci]|uniref:Uncharacterized protein n=1 Tax=Aphanomyces astaci TaxID=112090 RepID=W4H5A5_APHAT|nr:hypothetical protein H257_02155 [Aphanomyces astaci]ETV87180.1 hypothetical protein H257_02155 [Aphanomyces astaci]|eukprot:XP_009823979.1 hypothetical protein H257_02155 [Aphanomyces astaci]
MPVLILGYHQQRVGFPRFQVRLVYRRPLRWPRCVELRLARGRQAFGRHGSDHSRVFRQSKPNGLAREEPLDRAQRPRRHGRDLSLVVWDVHKSEPNVGDDRRRVVHELPTQRILADVAPPRVVHDPVQR